VPRPGGGPTGGPHYNIGPKFAPPRGSGSASPPPDGGGGSDGPPPAYPRDPAGDPAPGTGTQWPPGTGAATGAGAGNGAAATDAGAASSSDPLSSLEQLAGTAQTIGQAGQSALQAAQSGLAPLTAANNAKALADAFKPGRIGGPAKLGSAGGGAGIGEDDIASPRAFPEQQSKTLFPRASLAAAEEAEEAMLGRAGMAAGAGSAGSPGAGGGGAGAGAANRDKERKRSAALKSTEHIAEAIGDPMSITKPVVDL
jgi:hypothetical protein